MMSFQPWECNSCGLYNNCKRNKCQACFKPNDNKKVNGYFVPQKRLEATARILLMGVYDDTHILSKLRGVRFILKAIWEYILSFNKHIWPCHMQKYGGQEYMIKKCPIKFPEPTDININMMPFIRSNDFKKTLLPEYLKSYFELLIKPCLNTTELDYDKINYCGSDQSIYYLTIQESLVDKGRTQRRPGLHVETPGNTDQGYQIMWGSGGYYNYDPHGGLFMATNINNSCAIWNCKIVKSEGWQKLVTSNIIDNDKDVIGHLGDIEHLRSFLPHNKKHVMKQNELYWLTDRTPHEALPVDENMYRQFFRLVTSEVSVWYQQHSTKNPNGVEPDEDITTIIKENKFL